MFLTTNRRPASGAGTRAGALAALAAGLGRRAPRRLVGRGGAGGVEPLGQAAALAGRRVLVDRPLGRHLVQPLGDVAQGRLGLVERRGGDGGGERLHAFLDRFLAGAVARPALDALPDALLG